MPHHLVRRLAALAVLGWVLGACSVLLDTSCFEGECEPHGTPDATIEASGAVEASGADAADASAPRDAAEDAFDALAPCWAFNEDPCRKLRAPNGGCYCGNSDAPNFDPTSGAAQCIYKCADDAPYAFTESVKLCPQGCVVAPTGAPDYCVGSPKCVDTPAKCFATCTQ